MGKLPWREAPGSGRWSRRALLGTGGLAGSVPAVAAACILRPAERRTGSRPGVLTVAWNVGDVPGGEPAVRQLLEAVAEASLHPHSPAAAGYRLELERFITETFSESVLNARAWELRVGAMQHGYGPDLVIGGETFISLLATEGVLLPFDGAGAPAADVRAAEFLPAALDGLRTRGQLFALPLSVTPAVLYYNPKLFFRYGANPPQRDWSWRELLDAAQRLTQDIDPSGNPLTWGLLFDSGLPLAGPNVQLGSLLLPLIWQNGGDVVTRDLKASALDRDEAITAVEFVAELLHRRRVMPRTLQPAEGARLALAERVAMFYQYLGPLESWRSRFRIAELPQGRRRATGLEVVLAVAVNGRGPQAPLAARAALALADAGQAAGQQLVPARRDALEAMERHGPWNDQELVVIRNSLEYARTALPRISRRAIYYIRTALRTYLERPLVLNDRPPKLACQEAAVAISGILALAATD
jgi:hypothetical protein